MGPPGGPIFGPAVITYKKNRDCFAGPFLGPRNFLHSCFARALTCKRETAHQRRRPRQYGNVFVVLLRTQNWVRRKLKNGSVREAFCAQEAMWTLSVGGVGLGNAFLEALNEACLKSSFLDRFEEVLDVIVKAVLV